MIVSHVVIKVNDLTQALEEYTTEGFHVEYGTKNNPHNALIYFSEGPYIELLESAPLPFYIKWALIILGKGQVAERLQSWGSANAGIVDLCLENYSSDLKEEEKILKRYQQNYFITTSKRLDPQGRLLQWKLLFPYERRMPFLMTYFNIDPKPKNFVHPNGVKSITNVSYGTTEELIPLIKELCDDDVLDLFVGSGMRDIVYEK